MGENEKLLTVCELGRLGDIVTSEPIFRYLKSHHPDRKLRWYTKPAFAELLRYSPDVDEVVTVENAEEYLELKKDLPEGTISYELNFRSRAPAAKPAPETKPAPEKPAPPPETVPSLLEQFSVGAGLPALDETPRFHFRPGLEVAGLPERYVVFHCCSNGKSRVFPERRWRSLAEMFFAAGIPVVEIGIHRVLDLDHELYLDRTGVIDLQVAAKIIAAAQLFVGVESGFGHVANAVGASAIIICGKLDGCPYYNLYSGRFRRGEGVNLVRFYDVYAAALPFDVVRTVVRRWIDGSPMSAAECEIFCLKEQIERLHRNPLVRLTRSIADRIRRWRNGVLFHRLRHRKR